MIAKQSIASGRQANVIPLLSISSVRLKYLLANSIKYFTEEKKPMSACCMFLALKYKNYVVPSIQWRI